MRDPLDEALEHLDGLAREDPPVAAVEGARAEADRLGSARRTRIRHRLAVASVAALAVAGVSFTEPGRAATGWLADLAGFGEEPSLEQVGSVEGSAVVLDSGVLADGTEYELVVKRVNYDSMPIGPPEIPEGASERARRELEETHANDPFAGPGAMCFQVDFPGVAAGGQGGMCTDGSESGEGIGPESVSLHQPYERGGGSVLDYDSPALVVGIVEPSETDDVRVYERLPDGSQSELPSELIAIEGEVLARVGSERPKAVVVARLDDETVMAARRGEVEVRAIAFGPDGAAIGHDDVNFRPASCPDELAKPEPVPPAGRTADVRPASPAFDPGEIDQPFTDVCPPMLQVSGPPKFTAYELDPDAVPPDLGAASSLSSHPLEPATAEDYVLAYDPDAPLTNVDHAAQEVTGPAGNELGASTMGKPHIYLARLASDQTLVYVVDFSVRAVQVGRGWEQLPQKRRFLGIVNARNGKPVYFGEITG